MDRLIRRFLRRNKGRFVRCTLEDGRKSEGKLVNFSRKHLAISDGNGNITLVKRSSVSEYK